MYQKRWPIEVDNFYVKQHLGLADFRVQAYEATEKWFAVVFVALAFLQWRLNHAPAGTRWRFLAEVVRQHRYEHTRTLLETACQEAVRLADDVPVVQRFLSQPTYGSKKRQSPVMEMTQLVRHTRQGLRHSRADGGLAIRDNPDNGH
jgi:hypothetical protein